MGKPRNVDFFDPADEETVELTTPETTEEAAFRPDTNGDPEGSAERAEKPAIVLPSFYYEKYDLDDDGNPIFKPSVVTQIMEVFDAKKDTEVSFQGTDEAVEKQTLQYDDEILAIVGGLSPLLETQPQATGIRILQLMTDTWSEFCSRAWEYKASQATLKLDAELPDWFVQREDQLMAVARKARLIRDAVNTIDEQFGLNSTKLDRFRVQAAVERRQQRLAEWNYNKHADQTGKVGSRMNQATVEHCESIFANV